MVGSMSKEDLQMTTELNTNAAARYRHLVTTVKNACASKPITLCDLLEILEDHECENILESLARGEEDGLLKISVSVAWDGFFGPSRHRW